MGFLVPGGEFAGCSMADSVDALDPGMEACAPNLTPDPETGRITGWTFEQFEARMRAGKQYPGTTMPWDQYAGMTRDDLRAIYEFLRSLPPVVHDPGPSYRPVGWTRT